jgi:hypothetical protein
MSTAGEHWQLQVLTAYMRTATCLSLQKAGAEVYAIEDTNWKDDSKGLPGQQMSLQLMLRVVADVGLVGFPNAGGLPAWQQHVGLQCGSRCCVQCVLQRVVPVCAMSDTVHQHRCVSAESCVCCGRALWRQSGCGR